MRDNGLALSAAAALEQARIMVESAEKSGVPVAPPEWVTVKVAAALVGKAQRTVYRWIDRGLLATRHDNDGRVMVLSKAVGRIALEQRRGRPRGVPTRR